MGQSAQILDVTGVGGIIDMADHREEQRRHDAVRKHIGHSAVQADHIGGGDADHDIPHMGNRGEADHILQVGLRQADKRGINDADCGECRHHRGPELKTDRHHQEAHAEQTIGAKFFQQTRMDHRNGGGSTGVSIRRPVMERPHGGQRGEAQHHQEEGNNLMFRGNGPIQPLGGQSRHVESTLPRRVGENI